jgi:hemicentin
MTIGDNVTALTNTPISIDCPASGIPKPKITWRRNGEELSSKDGYVVYDNGTLQIKMASLKDKGKYTCFVKNGNGEANESSTVDVVSK